MVIVCQPMRSFSSYVSVSAESLLHPDTLLVCHPAAGFFHVQERFDGEGRSVAQA